MVMDPMDPTAFVQGWNGWVVLEANKGYDSFRLILVYVCMQGSLNEGFQGCWGKELAAGYTVG